MPRPHAGALAASAGAALKGLRSRARAGEILGFLGPNGAGKTTTMRIIAGFVAPSAGTATVLGHDVTREPQQAPVEAGSARAACLFRH